jgi:alpha-tubulin suppressor-like RCC1 family protein
MSHSSITKQFVISPSPFGILNPPLPNDSLYTASGEVAAFGWNEHGMCATGGTEDVIAIPTTVSGLPPHEKDDHMIVGTGAGHSLALVKLVSTSV